MTGVWQKQRQFCKLPLAHFLTIQIVLDLTIICFVTTQSYNSADKRDFCAVLTFTFVATSPQLFDQKLGARQMEWIYVALTAQETRQGPFLDKAAFIQLFP